MTRGGALVRKQPHPVEVVDTTGAGDVFQGAFIYGILEDWPLTESMHFANIAAGLSCEGIGGRSAIPELDEMLELCEHA
jgi:sugar/nucleoside kinase (ribokinase family)